MIKIFWIFPRSLQKYFLIIPIKIKKGNRPLDKSADLAGFDEQ